MGIFSNRGFRKTRAVSAQAPSDAASMQEGTADPAQARTYATPPQGEATADAVQTHDGSRRFEGRLLPRQDEDIEDQGLLFDMGTVLTRRRVLGALGIGAGTMALAACAGGASQSATSAAASTSAGVAGAAGADLAEMKTETAGPYPGDGSNGPDVLEISGVERRDIRSSIGGGATADGVEMTLTMNLIDMANGNAPLAGAAVYVWHCDAEGRYSMYDSALTDETYLRGVQIADSDGKVTFTSIMPGCYSGRWPHIHFEVFPEAASISDASNNVLTSQIALPQDVCELVYADSTYGNSTANLRGITLDSDNVFSDGWDAQMPAVTGDVTTGYSVSIDVPIDVTTEQTGGGAPGGAGGPGGTPPGSAGAPGGTPPGGAGAPDGPPAQ